MRRLNNPGVSLEIDRLASLSRRFREAVDAELDDFGDVIARDIRDNIISTGAIATGAYRDSVYVLSPHHNGFSTATTRAQMRRRDVLTEPFPMLTSRIRLRVGPCVHYAKFVEFGTSRMAARPATYPAFEKARREIAHNGFGARVKARFLK